MDYVVARLSLLLILVFETGLCCNEDQYNYSGRCYQLSLYKADIRLATSDCQVMGGGLAFANDTDTLHFFTTMIKFDEEEDYWILQSSGLEESADAAGCPYVRNNTIYSGQCAAKKYFICEYAAFISDFTCPESWYLFNTTCYKPMKMESTFINGQTLCENEAAINQLNGRLANLDDIDKIHFARILLGGRPQSYLVGATHNASHIGGLYSWMNGMEFEGPCCQEYVDIEDNCLTVHTVPDHGLEFKNVHCVDMNFFLCELNATTLSTTTTGKPSTTTLKPPTTWLPWQCPVGYNWKLHIGSGFCFWETTYETARLNWYQARQFCQAYGGDLATYRDAAQELHGLGGAKGHYRGLWFGLKRGMDDNIFRWVDGTSPNFTHWDSDEPNLSSRSKFCVVHGAYDSKWELDYCGTRRWFICKAPRVLRPVLPDVTNLFKTAPCNTTGEQVLRWWLYQDHCYAVSEEVRSWGAARRFCKEQGAELASVHSFNETDFILFTGEPSPSGNYWIGLNSLGLHSSFTWSDGSPLDFIYWPDYGAPTNAKDVCVAFDKQRGFWQTGHCNELLGVVCKRGVTASTEIPTPVPTMPLPGNCESGWYPLGNKCYKLFGDKWSQRLSYMMAEKQCENSSATLASVHNEEEQNFLSDLVLGVNSDVWIGLEIRDKRELGVFEWADGGIIDYTNWDSGQPSFSSGEENSFNGPRLCVSLVYSFDRMGKWQDGYCSLFRPYICKKDKNPALTRPSEDPFSCSTKPGWSKLGSSCYRLFEEDELSWIDAQRKCRTFDASLVAFRNTVVGIFLKKRITKEDQFLWIGIRKTAGLRYEGIHGKTLTFASWLPGQPQSVSPYPVDNCVAIDAQAKWMVRRCREAHPYICEWNSEAEEVGVVKEMESCPKNSGVWEDLGGESCYFFISFRLSWNNAMSYCFKRGGYLATFHSSEEVTLAAQRLGLDSLAPYVYIGMAKNSEGSFAWVDHSPVDFAQWDEDEEKDEDCVQMSIVDEKWSSIDCDQELPFVCSHPKKVVMEAMGLNSTNEETTVNSKLTIGGILGILICLAVIAAIIAVTVYYVCPHKTFRPQLLTTET